MHYALCIVVRENYTIWLKNFVYWGRRESLKIFLISLQGQKENVSNKETPPTIRDFMNERSLKLTKIFNLNLLKFDCQNLPFTEG